MIFSLKTISSEAELVIGVVALRTQCNKRIVRSGSFVRFLRLSDSTHVLGSKGRLNSLLLQVKEDGACLEDRKIVPVGIDDGWDSTVGADLDEPRLLLGVLAEVDGVSVVREPSFGFLEGDGHL